MIEFGTVKLLDLDEVCELLDIKKSTLRNYIYRGGIIQSIKLGQKRYIDSNDVENYLKGIPFAKEV